MPWKPLDLAAIGTLTFKAPDHAKYPCIPLAYAAGNNCCSNLLAFDVIVAIFLDVET